MWRAAGSDQARQPSNWLGSTDARRFIDVVREILVPRNSGDQKLIRVSRGGRGGSNTSTLAHWQIGLAYAKYLSPEQPRAFFFALAASGTLLSGESLPANGHRFSAPPPRRPGPIAS